MHKTTHPGEKRFKCDVCSKAFSTPSGLVTHKRCHTGEKPFKCDVCEKAFALSGNLKSHKTIHTGEKPFKCDDCGKAFPVSDRLKRHQRIHTGEKPFKSDVCDKGFTQSVNLKRHQRIHTRDKTKRDRSQVARELECKECNMTFWSPRIFHEHLFNHELEATEPTGMEYICGHCEETFDFAKTLRDHVSESHIWIRIIHLQQL